MYREMFVYKLHNKSKKGWAPTSHQQSEFKRPERENAEHLSLHVSLGMLVLHLKANLCVTFLNVESVFRHWLINLDKVTLLFILIPD